MWLGQQFLTSPRFRSLRRFPASSCAIAGLRRLPPGLLGHYVSYHADFLPQYRLGSGILDQIRPELALTVDHDVEPTVRAEPLGLEPFVGREGDIADPARDTGMRAG